MIKKLYVVLLLLVTLNSAGAQTWEYATYNSLSSIGGGAASFTHTWITSEENVSVEGIHGLSELHRELAGPGAGGGLVGLLNYFGSQGWELVTIDTTLTENSLGRVEFTTYIFKRMRP